MNKEVCKKIKTEFSKFVKENSKKEVEFSKWYVGITNAVKRRIAEHNVNKGKIKLFTSKYAFSLENANEIEKIFAKIGTANAVQKGGANTSSKYVYIFKMPSKEGLSGFDDGLNGYIKSIFTKAKKVKK